MADQRLKEAMAEINAIMKKFDIGGHVTLVSQTHSEFRYTVDPSWSCASVELLGGGMAEMRVKSLAKDHPDKEIQRKKIEVTIHMLAQIRDLGGKTFMEMDAVVNELSQQVDFDHKPFSGFEPHKEH